MQTQISHKHIRSYLLLCYASFCISLALYRDERILHGVTISLMSVSVCSALLRSLVFLVNPELVWRQLYAYCRSSQTRNQKFSSRKLLVVLFYEITVALIVRLQTCSSDFSGDNSRWSPPSTNFLLLLVVPDYFFTKSYCQNCRFFYVWCHSPIWFDQNWSDQLKKQFGINQYNIFSHLTSPYNRKGLALHSAASDPQRCWIKWPKPISLYFSTLSFWAFISQSFQCGLVSDLSEKYIPNAPVESENISSVLFAAPDNKNATDLLSGRWSDPTSQAETPLFISGEYEKENMKRLT